MRLRQHGSFLLPSLSGISLPLCIACARGQRTASRIPRGIGRHLLSAIYQSSRRQRGGKLPSRVEHFSLKWNWTATRGIVKTVAEHYAERPRADSRRESARRAEREA